MEKIMISYLQAAALVNNEATIDNLIAPPEQIDLTKYYLSHKPDNGVYVGKIEQEIALHFWWAHFYERVTKGLTHHLLKDSTLTLSKEWLARIHYLIDEASLLHQKAMNEAFTMLDEAYPEMVGKTILLYPDNYFRVKE
ncbi:MAG: hypothetical protein WCG55_01600 [bacterium]